MPTTAKTGARYTGIPATVLAAVRTISGFAFAPRLMKFSYILYKFFLLISILTLDFKRPQSRLPGIGKNKEHRWRGFVIRASRSARFGFSLAP